MQKPLNVLMISPYFFPLYGGAENQVLQLATFLSKMGYRFHVLTLGYPGAKNFERFPNGISIYRFGDFTTRYGMIKGYEEMKKWIQSHQNHNFLGVHQQLIFGANPKEQLELGKLIQDNGAWQLIKITSTNKARLLVEKSTIFLDYLKNANGIIALNGAIESELLDFGITTHQIYTIANGVNCDMFFPVNNNQRKIIRTEINLPGNSFIYLFVGRLVYKKGIDLLLQAWNKFCRDKPDVLLLIAGDDKLDVLKNQTSINTPYSDYVLCSL